MSETSSWWMRANHQVLELAVGLGLLLVGLFELLLPVLGAVGPLPPVTDTRTVSTSAAAVPDTTAGAMTLRGTGRADLVLDHPGLGDRLLLILPGLAGAVLLLVVLQALLLMARTFHAGDFFVPQNTRRLLVVAGALLLTGTLPPALDVLTTHLLVDGTPMERVVHTPYAMNTAAVVEALLAAAAAAAFRQGVRLHDDTEGLV